MASSSAQAAMPAQSMAASSAESPRTNGNGKTRTVGSAAKSSTPRGQAAQDAGGEKGSSAAPRLPSQLGNGLLSSIPARSSPLASTVSPRPLPIFKTSVGMAGQAQAASPSSSSASSSQKGKTKTSRQAATSSSPVASTSQEKLPHTLTSNDLINSNADVKSSVKVPERPSAASGKAKAQEAAVSAVALPFADAKKKASSSKGNGRTSSAQAKQARSTSSSESPDEQQSAKASETGRKGQRRRKANRACSHCQKAHLTCDDSRPCERCVKKGLADTCTDGARKKAKYLLDDEELEELKREKDRKERAESDEVEGEQPSSSNAAPPSVSAMTQDSSNAQQSWQDSTNFVGGMTLHNMGSSSLEQRNMPPSYASNAPALPAAMLPSHLDSSSVTSGTDATSNHQNGDNDMYSHLAPFSPASSNGLKHAFGSESASLEYSILSSMLNGIDPSWLSGSPDGQPSDGDMNRILGITDVTYGQQGNGLNSMGWTMPDGQQQQQQSATDMMDVSPWLNVATPGPSGNAASNQHDVENLPHLHLAQNNSAAQADGVAAYDALEVPSPGTSHGDGVNDGRHARLAIGDTEQDAQHSKAMAAAAAAGLDHKPDAVWKSRVRHIYGDRTRPFPYTDGYHFLIKYVTANLDKADVLRLIRALAIFRPSLIALQMPLTEDDEVFVERSIQRTILEFEKLISFSGTPTVVWRRTCEIVVVGAEFSMLTQWSRDHLRGRYIYEFFEKPSILEYWEKFAAHAFENTAQSIMMPITLKTSSGGTTRCAACFSIKRDMFDLPSLIVGNFLPILG